MPNIDSKLAQVKAVGFKISKQSENDEICFQIGQKNSLKVDQILDRILTTQYLFFDNF
jgi:hypothetical protein